MKTIMKTTIMLLTVSASALLVGCKKESIDETITVIPPTPIPVARVLGDWELYKAEKNVLITDVIIDSNGQPSAVNSIAWGDVTSPMSNEITYKFNDNHTFQEFYAGVQTGQGNWEEVASKPDEFTMVYDVTPDFALEDTFMVKIHCDNTMSVQVRMVPPAGNIGLDNEVWTYISYYRTPETLQCDDLIDYQVD